MFDRHHGVWPENVPLTLTLPETSLYENLEISARRYPERAALIYYDRVLSFRRLDDEVNRLAGFLQAKGVAAGDRVLLFMQNAPQFVIAYYAILRADAVVVPVNPMNQTPELAHYIDDTGATVAICGQERFEAMAPWLTEGRIATCVVAAYNDYIDPDTDLDLPAEVAAPAAVLDVPGAVAWGDALNAGHEPAPHTASRDDLAVLPYSSGTTGLPKGCMHTHGSVNATAVNGLVWTRSHPEGFTLGTLPLFHVTGMQNSMNAPIYAGSTVVLMTRWDRRTAARLIERYRINRWTSIVTMVIDMLSDPEIERFDLSSLEHLSGGGAAMPEAVSDKLFALTGRRYVEGYGLSETIAATHLNPPDAPKKQCLGVPLFDVDSRIVDPETKSELGVGEVGEIITRGPQVQKGYWNRPDANAESYMELDGHRFFRTGDLGYYDEEGYFFIVDRVKRMINASGYKVWPAEVESMMFGHPAIREACVISQPNARRGESVKACVVLADGASATPDEIRAWCREQMAAYKVPSVIEIRESLPRSPTGKVQWRALQEQEWAEADTADA